jgi:DinB superfamily
MAETVPEYRKRILDHVGSEEPLQLQAAAPKKIERLLKGVATAKLRKRPAPEKWSIAEILAHLVDTEIVAGYRMRMTLGAPGTPIQAFDQNAWATTGHYAERDARKSLELYRAVRVANLALLKLLRPDQWKHYGIHAERGEESIETIVRMMAGHDLNHIKQIEGILRKKAQERRKGKSRSRAALGRPHPPS